MVNIIVTLAFMYISFIMGAKYELHLINRELDKVMDNER